MLATLICNECGDAVAVSNRSISLPFICEKHQAKPSVECPCGRTEPHTHKYDTTPWEPVPETPSKESVDTTSLITDLAQQLNEASVARDNAFREAEVAIKEAEDLASKNVQQANDIDLLNICLDAKENRVIAKETQIANQAGTIKRLEAQNTLTTSYAVNLSKELLYAAKRVFTLAAENGRLKAEIKLVTEERETAYASELALHNKLAQYITALDDRKKEVKTARESFIREYKGKIDQWRQKRELQDRLEHPWKNLWKFYQDKVR